MPTLSEAILTFCKIDRSPATNTLYWRVLHRLSTAAGSERDVTRLTYEDLIDFMDALERKRLKDSTRKMYSLVIKTFCNWCVSHRYIPESPAADLRVRVKKDDHRAVKAIPPEDLQKMLDYVRHSRRNYAMLLFMIDTGCRVGGLCSLTTRNLDLEKSTAWLFEKGGKWHQAFFGPETNAALRRWLDRRPLPASGHDYVWAGRAPHYQPLTIAAVEAIIRRTSRNAECSQSWYPHAIRHAVGHAWAKAGLPATAVQDKLGHEHVNTTLEHYFPRGKEYVEDLSRRYSLIALRQPENKVSEMPIVLPPPQMPRRVK